MTRQKGFSAIEVLVAIAFLAILAGGVWVWWNGKPQGEDTAPSTTLDLTPQRGVSPTVTIPPDESTVVSPAGDPLKEKIQNAIAYFDKGKIIFIDTKGNTLQGINLSEAGYIEKSEWSPTHTRLAVLTRKENDMSVVVANLFTKSIQVVVKTQKLDDFGWLGEDDASLVVSHDLNNVTRIPCCDKQVKLDDYPSLFKNQFVIEGIEGRSGGKVFYKEVHSADNMISLFNLADATSRVLLTGNGESMLGDFDVNEEGSEIVFIQDDKLWIHNIPTNVTTILREEFVLSPAFSPDNTWVSYHITGIDYSNYGLVNLQSLGGWEINFEKQIEPFSANPASLVKKVMAAVIMNKYSFYNLEWSPRGTEFVVNYQNPKTQKEEIWLFAADGSIFRRIVREKPFASPIAW